MTQDGDEQLKCYIAQHLHHLLLNYVAASVHLELVLTSSIHRMDHLVGLFDPTEDDTNLMPERLPPEVISSVDASIGYF